MLVGSLIDAPRTLRIDYGGVAFHAGYKGCYPLEHESSLVASLYFQESH